MNPSEYDNIARQENDHWWYRGLRRIVAAAGNKALEGSSRVLDVGCGTGGMMRDLHRRWPNTTLVGVDFSFDAVKYTRDAGLVVQADGNSLPIGSDTMDVVISLDTLYHRNIDEARALSEMLRVLKPSGTAIVNVPAFEWLRSYHDRFVETARRYTTRRLRSAATGAGFIVDACFYRNSFLFPLMVAERYLVRVVRGNVDRSAVVRHSRLTNGIFSAVLSAEAALLSRGLRLPAGGSVFAVLRKPGTGVSSPKPGP